MIHIVEVLNLLHYVLYNLKFHFALSGLDPGWGECWTMISMLTRDAD
jgi:hypothetical protein